MGELRLTLRMEQEVSSLLSTINILTCQHHNTSTSWHVNIHVWTIIMKLKSPWPMEEEVYLTRWWYRCYSMHIKSVLCVKRITIILIILIPGTQGSAAGFTLAPTDELLSVANPFLFSFKFKRILGNSHITLSIAINFNITFETKSEQVLQTYSTSLGLNVHALGFRWC